MPVISCRFPMSRKAASSVVSSGSTTTRPPGSSARNSGSSGGPVRGEHDGLAQVEQCPCGVRPDGTQAAGDEDHDRDARPEPVAALVRNGHPRVGASGCTTRRGRARKLHASRDCARNSPGVTPRSRRHSRLRCAWSWYPASTAHRARSTVAAPCSAIDAWTRATKTWKRRMRCSSFGPTPTAARHRRRSWRSEIDSNAGRAAVPLPRHGMRFRTASFTNGSGSPRGPRDERLEPVERDPRCRGLPETIRQAGQVAPEVGAGDVLVDQLVGRHPDETAEHPRTQPHPDDRAPRRDLLVRPRGQGPEQPGRLTEHAAHLGAAVWHVPLRQGPVARPAGSRPTTRTRRAQASARARRRTTPRPPHHPARLRGRRSPAVSSDPAPGASAVADGAARSRRRRGSGAP